MEVGMQGRKEGRRGREEKDHTGHCKPQWFFAWVRARGLPGRSKGNSQKYSSKRVRHS